MIKREISFKCMHSYNSFYLFFRAVTLIIIGLDDAGKTTMVASLKGGNDVSCQNIKNTSRIHLHKNERPLSCRQEISLFSPLGPIHNILSSQATLLVHLYSQWVISNIMPILIQNLVYI